MSSETSQHASAASEKLTFDCLHLDTRIQSCTVCVEVKFLISMCAPCACMLVSSTTQHGPCMATFVDIILNKTIV